MAGVAGTEAGGLMPAREWRIDFIFPIITSFDVGLRPCLDAPYSSAATTRATTCHFTAHVPTHNPFSFNNGN